MKRALYGAAVLAATAWAQAQQPGSSGALPPEPPAPPPAPSATPPAPAPSAAPTESAPPSPQAPPATAPPAAYPPPAGYYPPPGAYPPPPPDTAVHLEQSVLPRVPIRHWICSLPWGLRALLGYDRKLCAEVVRVHG